MKHLLVVVLGAALWLAPTTAQACGCCHDQDQHAGHAAAQPAQPAAAKLAPGEARVEIPVTGMHCGNCVSRVEAALGKLEGVKSTEVRLADGKVIVVYEKAKLAPAKLVEAIDALGYKAGKPSQG